MTVEGLQLAAEIKAHEEPVWSISVHSTLPLLATCSSDKTSKLYDISNLNNVKEVTILDEQTHTKTIRSISFKPSNSKDYPTLALGSFDSTCSIWGADSYKSDWELLAVVEGHENEVKCIDWSKDGKYLATCARDKTVWIWETDEMNEEFECIAVLSEHEGDVKYVKWDNEHSFMSCSYDDTLRIWRQDEYDDDEWNCTAVIRFENTVWSAAWVNQDTIVCCIDDGEVLMYERIKEGNEIDEDITKSESKLPNTIKKVEEWRINSQFRSSVSKIHNGSVYSVESKNEVIVSGGRDGVVAVYKKINDEWVVTGIQRLAHGVNEVNHVVIADADTAVSCGDDGSVKIWKI
jgi:WD40 repeat protein